MSDTDFSFAPDSLREGIDIAVGSYGEGNMHGGSQMFSQLLERYTEESEQTTIATCWAKELRTLGRRQMQERDFLSASKNFEQATELVKGKIERDDEFWLSLLTDYAHSLDEMYEYEKTLVMHCELHVTSKKKYGENHHNTLLAESGIATSVRYFGDWHFGSVLRHHALEGFFREGGEAGEDYQRELENLAADYSCVGDDHRALRLLEQAYDLREMYRGAGDPLTVNALNLIGKQRYLMMDYTGAAEVFSRAEQLTRDSEDYYSMLYTAVLAECCARLGDVPSANKLNGRLERSFAKVNYPVREIMEIMIRTDSVLALNRGDLTKAESIARTWVEGSGDNLYQNGRAKLFLAEILLYCGKYRDALDELSGLGDHFTKRKVDLRSEHQFFCCIAAARAGLGDMKLAEKYLDLALKIREQCCSAGFMFRQWAAAAFLDRRSDNRKGYLKNKRLAQALAGHGIDSRSIEFRMLEKFK